MKFVRWDVTKPSTKGNIVILSKSEINKHMELKGKEDLEKFYSPEVYKRIINILDNLHHNK
jgi:hypothetical protein